LSVLGSPELARSSRSENGQNALYAIRADGSGLVRLDNASGGPSTTDNFQPRFSPFVQDGYFWLSFLSRRDYGNNLAGTAGIRHDSPPGVFTNEPRSPIL